MGTARLIPHERYLAQLAGVRTFLLQDRLPFLDPVVASPIHPDRLLRRVTELAGRRGVLVVGQSGAGKTRTLVEVAIRAHNAGWPVFHVVTGESLATTEGPTAEVRLGPGRAVVLCDDLDQLAGLDVWTIGPRLLGAGWRRRDVAVLASARPGWPASAGSGVESLFERVEMSGDHSSAAAVTRRITQTVAPGARSILGAGEAERVCGLRPMGAVLVGVELERRARAGRLSGHTTHGVGAGDLLAWLRLRVGDDLEGTVPSALPPVGDPDPQAEAMAAVMAAAPQDRTALAEVAIAVLGARVPDPNTEAERLVALLADLGWLEQQGSELAVVHDVAVNEVLGRTVIDGQTVRRATLERILDASAERSRSLGRLATSLRRLLGDMAATEAKARLEEACSAWLVHNQDQVAATVGGDEDPARASYALGAVVAGPPWLDAVVAHWDSVVAPWLDTTGADVEAVHLLSKGLRAIPQGQEGAVATAACRWLGAHPSPLEASLVLGPLLGRQELEPPDAAVAVRAALGWLDHHGEAPEAAWVFRPLLGRPELEPAGAAVAVRAALAWLDHHGEAPEALSVIDALLRRSELEPPGLGVVVRAALTWLDHHGGAPEARLVLGPLLWRQDLDPGDVAVAVPAALAWLDDHGEALEATPVLRSLLRRNEPGEAATVVEAALAWLDHHSQALEASWVLRPLLGRAELERADVAVAVRRALAWLDHHGEELDARLVLGPLLQRQDLEPDQVAMAVRMALAWLDHHREALEAVWVLRPLLERDGLDEEARSRAAGYAASWLARFSTRHEAVYVTKALVHSRDLDDQTAGHVLTWIAAFPDDQDALWRLTQLKRWLHHTELVDKTLEAFERVLFEVMRSEDVASETASQIETTLSYLTVFQCGVPAARVDDLLAAWARHPASFAPGNVPNPNVERPALVSRLLSVYMTERVAEPDRAQLVKRLEAWVGTWSQPEMRNNARGLLKRALPPPRRSRMAPSRSGHTSPGGKR